MPGRLTTAFGETGPDLAAGGPVRAVVLADTHLRTVASGGRWLPDALDERLHDADVVLHAGDVVDEGVLDRLADRAPVVAVLGNNDAGLEGRLAESVELLLGGVRLGMVHDSGPSKGRPARLRRRFPDCAVVVFGHSHIPVDEPGIDGQVLFNPGSPTQRRRQPWPSFGELVLGGGRVLHHAVVPLATPASGRR